MASQKLQMKHGTKFKSVHSALKLKHQIAQKIINRWRPLLTPENESIQMNIGKKLSWLGKLKPIERRVYHPPFDDDWRRAFFFSTVRMDVSVCKLLWDSVLVIIISSVC